MTTPLVARGADDAQRADFQVAACQQPGCGNASPDVRLQRQPVGRFDESHGRGSLLQKARSPAAGSGHVDALGVGQTKFILVDADFEAAGDGDGSGPTGAGRARRARGAIASDPGSFVAALS